MKEKEKLSNKYIKLSKFLSYVLRHHPEDFHLKLDDQGFIPMENLMKCLEKTGHSWANVEDIKKLISEGQKRRFEIKGDKIRALYGHSVSINIKNSFSPKKPLYHGTSPKSLREILTEGLKPMKRQYVHLSRNPEEAYRVGERHHPQPFILKIDAEKANRKGVSFFDRGEVILSEEIPPEFIELLEK